MIRTDNFVHALSDKGLVDDAMFLENGYDLQYKGNIVSVRLNDKGGAVIFNQKKNSLIEIQSGRLDEVLHKYIFQSLFGLQSKLGTKDIDCKNVAFVPTKVVRNSVVFEDAAGRKFTVNGNSPKAVLSYYKEALEVNADDCMVLLSNFVPYDHTENFVTSNAETPDVELQILKCSVNAEDYAVSPRVESINSVGQTIVGNFLCSGADKWNLQTFEEDQEKVFAFNSLLRKKVTSSTVRSRNPVVSKAVAMFKPKSSLVSKYVDRRYPDGLCVSALQNVLAYEAPAICSELEMKNEVGYDHIFQSMLKDADRVRFRIDSNRSILCAVEKDGVSAAKFRAVPVLSEMREPLAANGYLLTELESGLEFSTKDTAVNAVVSACKEFTPVVENAVNKPNTVSRVIGSDCKDALKTYGINDTKGAFSSFYRVVLN